MKPQPTIASVLAELDTALEQLAFARNACKELVALVDTLRAERDTWRAAAS